jgi:hypothetical protein
MAAAQYPGWSGDGGETDRDWDTCILGGVILPGTVSIEGFDVGIDLDTKKAKGSDQPKSSDNGVKAAEFTIEIWLNQKQWAEFQGTIDYWNPRRPGRERAPLEILHPMVNVFGIRTVRVVNVSAKQPSAKSGLRVSIKVAEWFDKPKATVNNKIKPENARDYPRVSEAIAVGGGIAGIHGLRSPRPFETGEELDPTTFQPIGPSHPEVVEKNLFP